MPKLSRFFHKQCVNKSTSQQEFSLIKKGELDFNCDDCVKSRLGLNHVKTPALEHVQEPQDSFVDTEGKANNEQNKCGEYVGSNSSVSTQTDSSKCLKCEKLEAEKIELVCEMDKIHELASKEHEKFELLVMENEDLKAKLEEVAAKQDEVDGTSDLARTKADLDRIKFLYEKAMKDIAKLEEVHKKEVRELVSQKFESDYRS